VEANFAGVWGRSCGTDDENVAILMDARPFGRSHVA
jgi:hypothetical protein